MPPTVRHALSFVFLFGIAGAAGYLAESAWSSVTNYQPRQAFREVLPAGEPLASRVALVVLDGIRLDVSTRMENLQSLAARGSSGVARTVLPSLSNPSRATMVTGAWPEVTGVTTNRAIRPPAIDSIFSLARQAGVPVAVAGSSFWTRAFGIEPSRGMRFPKEPDHRAGATELAAWQRQVCEAFLPSLTEQPAGFLVAGLSAADEAGHEFGGESAAYLEVVDAVDDCLGELTAALDDGQTTFVVVSDHGHIQRRGAGGHGGSEEEVLYVPLVLAGPGIGSSSGWRAAMIDVAPTICALLGLPLPATNQGEVLWQALSAPAGLIDSLRARAEEQRQLAAARFPNGTEALSQARRGRRLPAFLAILLALGMLAAAASLAAGDRRRLALAMVLYYAAYYALFAALGLGYSLSAISREEYVYNFLGRNVIAAGIALVVACLFAFRGRPQSGRAIAPALTILIASTLVLQVAANYYFHGLIMRDSMLDLDAGLKAYLDLSQLLAIAPVSLVMFLAMRPRR